MNTLIFRIQIVVDFRVWLEMTNSLCCFLCRQISVQGPLSLTGHARIGGLPALVALTCAHLHPTSAFYAFCPPCLHYVGRATTYAALCT